MSWEKEIEELRQNPPMLCGKPWFELSNLDGSINAAATANNYAMSEAYEEDFKQNYRARRQDGLQSYFGIVMQGTVREVSQR